ILIYNTGSNYPNPGGNFGGITVSGNGTVNLSAATTGTYAGISVFQSRENPRALSLGSNAMAGLNGAIYAPSALLSISGNVQASTPLIVYQLKVGGNGTSTLAAGGFAGGSDALVPGELIAGNLWLYLDDPGGQFTADQRARVQDAIARLDEL